MKLKQGPSFNRERYEGFRLNGEASKSLGFSDFLFGSRDMLMLFSLPILHPSQCCYELKYSMSHNVTLALAACLSPS